MTWFELLCTLSDLDADELNMPAKIKINDENHIIVHDDLCINNIYDGIDYE